MSLQDIEHQTPETDRLEEEFKKDPQGLGPEVKLDVLFGYTRKLEKYCTKLEHDIVHLQKKYEEMDQRRQSLLETICKCKDIINKQ